MLYQNVHVFARLLHAIDAGTLAGTVLVLWWLDLPPNAWSDTSRWSLALLIGSLLVAFSLIALRLHIYHTRRTETLWRELLALLETSVLAIGSSCLLVELVTGGLSGLAYGAVALCGPAVLMLIRVVVRLSLRRLRKTGRDYRSWLLIGRNPRSARIARAVLANPHYGIRIVGVLDVPRQPGHHGYDTTPWEEEPLSLLPQMETPRPDLVQDVLRRRRVDEVAVTLPMRSFYDEIGALLQLCGEAGISVKFPAKLFDREGDNTEVMQLGNVPLVTHYSGPSDEFSLALKRIVDLIGSAAGLLVLSPLLLAIAAAIKLTSRGPVLFRQTRVGLHSRRFTLFKFRTMVSDAVARHADLRGSSDTDGPAFKMKNDPRVTRVGRLLRRYKLDELPQLWNVLLGDMSLVGPRPLPEKEAEKYEWWQRRRLSMPPGLTCLWQVENDHEMPFERWMQLDLEYIDRWSLGLDFRLLFSTIGTVLRGRGW